jgi:site-specific DNA recombinase
MALQGRIVQVIPATVNPLTKAPNMTMVKRRTAGYARVSTDKDEQFTSYEAQIDYYTQWSLLQNNPVGNIAFATGLGLPLFVL